MKIFFYIKKLLYYYYEIYVDKLLLLLLLLRKTLVNHRIYKCFEVINSIGYLLLEQWNNETYETYVKTNE